MRRIKAETLNLTTGNHERRLAAQENDYALVARHGSDPSAIVIGMTHPEQGKIHELPKILRLLQRMAREGDVILIEGGNGLLTKDTRSTQVGSTFYETLYTALAENGCTAAFNDSVKLQWQHQIQGLSLIGTDSRYHKNQFATEIFALMLARDKHFCHDPKYGIVAILLNQSPAIQLGKGNRVFQIVGYAHVLYGDIAAELKNHGIAYEMYAPLAFTKDRPREITDVKDMQATATSWFKLVHELGYVGFDRKKLENLDTKWGSDGWVMAHIYRGETITTRQALRLYEGSYVRFLKKEPAVLYWLTKNASDVYDINPEDVLSGLDFSVQNQAATHFHDIAVRRALKRLGHEFRGDHLVHIRGHTSEGYVLNPGRVPFLNPKDILSDNNVHWYAKGSVEDFYQSNKVIIVNPENFSPIHVMNGPEGTYYKLNDGSVYLQDSNDPKMFCAVPQADLTNRYIAGANNEQG
jgi:hypothetical protein